MDPGFDSARSAGYRDVVVNLQLVSKDAEQLGVERHICEVQLILVPIFERKVQRFSLVVLFNHPEIEQSVFDF